jgi:hypothetical protein
MVLKKAYETRTIILRGLWLFRNNEAVKRPSQFPLYACYRLLVQSSQRGILGFVYISYPSFFATERLLQSTVTLSEVLAASGRVFEPVYGSSLRLGEGRVSTYDSEELE